MAVARLTDKPIVLLRLAEQIEEGESRAARELRRGAQRPGSTAELTPSEARAVAELDPERPSLVKMLVQLSLAETYEQERDEYVREQRRVREMSRRG